LPSSWGDRFYGAEERALPELREILVEGFAPGSAPWQVEIPPEDGSAQARLFGGTSDGASSEMPSDSPRPGMLGLRVDFQRRGSSSLLIGPSRPIPIEGECRSLSVRVLGRSFRHVAYLVVLDYYGRSFDLPLGPLSFSGWKTLWAYLPPLDPATGRGIVQDDRHFPRSPGIRLAGLRLVFDPDDAYGSFYVYFCDFRALTLVQVDGETVTATVESPNASVEGGGSLRGAASEAAWEPVDAGDAPGEAPSAERVEPSPPETSPPGPGPRVLARITELVAAAQTYPEAARRRGLAGSLVARFVVDVDGSLASAELASSSGSEILDRAGLELLRSVFPVENDSGSRLSLRITISYRLGSLP